MLTYNEHVLKVKQELDEKQNSFMNSIILLRRKTITTQ